MPIKFYNSYTRALEDFKPTTEGVVKLYTCGPTVYDYPHIGNYRAYIFADILKRYLLYKGFEVDHTMNITDVDDKTIRDSQKLGKSLQEFTEFYTQEFFKDRDLLHIIPAHNYPKATDYITDMVHIIEKLLDKGVAYTSADGSVYFDISKFQNYGKLSHIEVAELKENAKGRMKSDEYEKDSAQDFALWKAYDENDGEVYWETSLGKGRPGWHIECTAMSIQNLGEQIDIHTGGVDNMFPHHENELAQSESYTSKQFVRYWMHNEWLLVNGKKMSKSAGNFYTLRDLMDKGIEPLAYRFWLLTSHYRTLTNLNIDALQGSQNALRRLYDAFLDLGSETAPEPDKSYVAKFQTFLDDDLDTPQAVALMWELVKDASVSSSVKKSTLLNFDKVFGLGFADIKTIEVPDEVKKLVDEREYTRSQKDWATSDILRSKINALGYDVKDTESGPKISNL